MKKIIMVFKFVGIWFWLLSKEFACHHVRKLERENRFDEARALTHKYTSKWGKLMTDVIGCNPVMEVHGIEKIPQGRACVFMPNHQSILDVTVMLAKVGVPIGFIAKAELRKIPFLNHWMDLMRCVFLHRKSPRRTVQEMAKAVENVKAGYSLVIFPEGTRSKTGEIAEFKAGSFKLAERSEAPIVPVTINGTRDLLENGRKKNGRVEIFIHDPIETANLSHEEKQALPQKIQQIVASKYRQHCE